MDPMLSFSLSRVNSLTLSDRMPVVWPFGVYKISTVKNDVFLIYILTVTFNKTMKKQKLLTVRLNEDLYEMAKQKCKSDFGIGLSPLIKVFLRSFVSQRGVGFYVGDEDLSLLFNRWLHKKYLEKNRKGCAPLPGPKLKDLYDL